MSTEAEPVSVAEDKGVVIDKQKTREQLLKSMQEEVAELKSLKAGLVADLQNVVQLLKESKIQTDAFLDSLENAEKNTTKTD